MKKILILALITVFIFIGCREKSPLVTETDSTQGESSASPEIADDTGGENTAPFEGTRVSVCPRCLPSYGVTLLLPKDWKYDVIQSDDEPASDLTMSIYPEAVEGRGAISISYMQGFGVCGTGLDQKETLFNGHEAKQGFYDGNSLWSFIALKDPKDCVIINSAEDWYADYEKEINQILSTVEFVYYERLIDPVTYEGYLIASASLDIDGDGVKEDCDIKGGPTSGLFTIVFIASRNGNVLYCNTFNLSGVGNLLLEEKDGIPYLVTERYFVGKDLETEHHRVHVEGKQIVIDNLGEFEGYWGDENWNFDQR